MTRSLRIILPILAVGLFAICYYFLKQLVPAVCILAAGSLWLAAILLKKSWVPNIGIVFGLLCGAVGILLAHNLHPSGATFDPITFLFILGACLALLAGDMDAFFHRTQVDAIHEDMLALEKYHLLRLGIPFIAGIILTIIVLDIHIKISIEVVIILMLASTWGLTRLMNNEN